MPADAPPHPHPRDSTNGGSSSVSAPAEQIEKRLRESLISIGLLRHEEMAAPLRPDGVGDELRKLQGPARAARTAECKGARADW